MAVEWKPISELKAKGEMVLTYDCECGFGLMLDYNAEDNPEAGDYYLADVPDPPADPPK